MRSLRGAVVTSQVDRFCTGVLYALALCTEVSAITARITVCYIDITVKKNMVRVILRSMNVVRLRAEPKD